MTIDTNVNTPPPIDDNQITLALYAERAYLDYAVSVIKGRALPETADGQKPVQRRILFAMHEMGLRANAKPVKSARVVGDVLGKFHPHGDQAAYEALVRMAQGFTMRYPLIDGQGNFGSRDGDGAAAMRYTEARLTPLAGLLLGELDMGTVDFVPNYDGSFEEPKLLPARLPMVLLNGASGIAVGMATDIPPHNLNELAAATIELIKKPTASLDTVMAHLPGPDFPGGGQIISAPQVLKDIYASGRGSMKVRARFMVEELARGQWQWVVTELPPNTSCAKVLEEIEELSNPKIKAGKKTLSAEQTLLKTQMLSMLDAVRDESSKDNPVRLVFEPKSKNIDLDEFASMMLVHTSLESNVSVNLVTINGQGKPGQRGILPILLDWIAFRKHTIIRRSQHRLEQVNDRIHVLEGRLIAWLHIDEVIAIIRESDEPKAALMQTFALSERQAEDILEIRLRQLARLEKIKIEQERAALQLEHAELQALLGDETKLKNKMIAEIRKDAQQFSDARRTLIEEEDKASVDMKVPEEDITLIVSKQFWIRTRQGHDVDIEQLSFKPGDSLYAAFLTQNTQTTYLFGDGVAKGRVFSVPNSTWPGGRTDGIPAHSVVDLQGGQICKAVAAQLSQQILLATSDGYAFVCLAAHLNGRQKSGKNFIFLPDDVYLLDPYLIDDASSPVYVAVLSKTGVIHIFPFSELKTMPTGGRGLQMLPLKPKDELLSVITLAPNDVLLVGGHGRAGKEKTLQFIAKEWKEWVGVRGKLLKHTMVQWPNAFKPIQLTRESA